LNIPHRNVNYVNGKGTQYVCEIILFSFSMTVFTGNAQFFLVEFSYLEGEDVEHSNYDHIYNKNY